MNHDPFLLGRFKRKMDNMTLGRTLRRSHSRPFEKVRKRRQGITLEFMTLFEVRGSLKDENINYLTLK